jgi:hypothetical protein
MFSSQDTPIDPVLSSPVIGGLDQTLPLVKSKYKQLWRHSSKMGTINLVTQGTITIKLEGSLYR